MKEVTLTVPHAILFVNDPAHGQIEIPEYVPGHVTSANASCVSICTRADVDGDVTVRLGTMLPKCAPTECVTVAEYCIETPGRNVGVFTSENRMILTVDVPNDSARVTITVDDPQSPGLIDIGVQ